MSNECPLRMFGARFSHIDCLNHASGQSFKAYPVLGSVSYHWRRAICQPPRLQGKSGMLTPASGMVFVRETAVCSVLAGQCVALGGAGGAKQPKLGEGEGRICSSCSVVGVGMEVIGCRERCIQC